MKRTFLIASLGLFPLLAGCGGVAETLGFGRNAPDEFAVVDRPPLAMPPDYSLRPPKPGAPRPQETAATTHASAMLFGPNAKVATTTDRNNVDSDTQVRSVAEKALLETAGTDKAEPDIREVVDREAAEKVAANPHLIDSLLWWRKSEPPATTVDAPEEAERIKEAKEKGEPVNQGATPVIEKRKSGWIGL